MTLTRVEEICPAEETESQLPCIECHGQTAHAVVVRFRVEQRDEVPDYSNVWVSNYETVKCLGCKTVSFRKVTWSSEDIGPDDYGDLVPFEHATLYPPRIVGRKGIEGDLYILSKSMRRLYQETLQALNSDMPVLTGIGVRALVEAVCKEMNAAGYTLANKIEDLKDKGLLTAERVGILHQIRALGNSAAHETKPHTAAQLGLALDVVDNLLMDVYILPAKAKETFPELKEK